MKKQMFSLAAASLMAAALCTPVPLGLAAEPSPEASETQPAPPAALGAATQPAPESPILPTPPPAPGALPPPRLDVPVPPPAPAPLPAGNMDNDLTSGLRPTAPNPPPPSPIAMPAHGVAPVPSEPSLPMKKSVRAKKRPAPPEPAMELNADDSLGAGLMEEERDLDLPKAMKRYQAAIARFDRQRAQAAQATFRLAECYRKLGQMEEAKVQYSRIMREFSDQADLVKASEHYLFKPDAEGAPQHLIAPKLDFDYKFDNEGMPPKARFDRKKRDMAPPPEPNERMERDENLDTEEAMENNSDENEDSQIPALNKSRQLAKPGVKFVPKTDETLRSLKKLHELLDQQHQKLEQQRQKLEQQRQKLDQLNKNKLDMQFEQLDQLNKNKNVNDMGLSRLSNKLRNATPDIQQQIDEARTEMDLAKVNVRNVTKQVKDLQKTLEAIVSADPEHLPPPADADPQYARLREGLIMTQMNSNENDTNSESQRLANQQYEASKKSIKKYVDTIYKPTVAASLKFAANQLNQAKAEAEEARMKFEKTRSELQQKLKAAREKERDEMENAEEDLQK